MTETLLLRLQDRVPRVDLLVAPGAPVLYPAELPAWLRRSCETTSPMARQVLDEMTPDWRDHTFYPLEELAASPLPAPAIPRRFLHWDGVGAGQAVSLWAEGQRGLPRVLDMAGAWHRYPSDLSGFFPGLRLWSRGLEPVMTGLDYCMGWPCFPDVAEIARVLVAGRRIRAAQPGAGRGGFSCSRISSVRRPPLG